MVILDGWRYYRRFLFMSLAYLDAWAMDGFAIGLWYGMGYWVWGMVALGMGCFGWLGNFTCGQNGLDLIEI